MRHYSYDICIFIYGARIRFTRKFSPFTFMRSHCGLQSPASARTEHRTLSSVRQSNHLTASLVCHCGILCAAGACRGCIYIYNAPSLHCQAFVIYKYSWLLWWFHASYVQHNIEKQELRMVLVKPRLTSQGNFAPIYQHYTNATVPNYQLAL